MTYRIEDGVNVVASGDTMEDALTSMAEVFQDLSANVLEHPDYANPNGWIVLVFEVGGSLYDEKDFFKELPWTDAVQFKLLEEMAPKLISFNRENGTRYSHAELETGSALFEYLVTQDEFEMGNYQEFLGSIDLDHTVEQLDVVGRLIDLHGLDNDEVDDLVNWLGDQESELFDDLLDSYSDELNIPPLHQAVQRGDDEDVGRLIAEGADLEQVHIHNGTPLSCARTVPMLELLLEAGAKVGGTFRNGDTALHDLVAVGDNAPLVARLLAAGAAPNAENDEGKTPLFVACAPECMSLLLDSGADIHHRSHQGETMLHSISCLPVVPAIRTALERGADANAVDKQGRSALHMAKMVGLKSNCYLLVECGADPFLKDNDGKAPIDASTFIWPPEVEAERARRRETSIVES